MWKLKELNNIKPTTRVEKVDFLIKKLGLFDTLAMVYLTDEQLNDYFNKNYKSLNRKKDFAVDIKFLKSNKSDEPGKQNRTNYDGYYESV